MKNVFKILLIAVPLALTQNSYAALISVTQDGGLLVSDTASNVTWADTASPNSLTWSSTGTAGSAQAWVASLNSEDYGGYNDWALPSYDLLNTLFLGELGNPGYPSPVASVAPFHSISLSDAFWSSTAVPNYGAGWALFFNLPDSGTYPVAGGFGASALAVRDGAVSPVPLPPSAWLMLSGLMTLFMGFRLTNHGRERRDRLQKSKAPSSPPLLPGTVSIPFGSIADDYSPL